MNTLPTYSIERVAKTTNVKRLLRFGRELAYDKLDTNALTTYRTMLLSVLDTEREKRTSTKQFKDALVGAGKLDVRRVGVTYGRDGELVVEETQFDVAGENIHDLYTQAGRLLGEGLHAAYVKARVENAKGKRPQLAAAKKELHALLQIEEVRNNLEVVAGLELTTGFLNHSPAIRKLPDERRQRYRRLQKQARRPEPYMIELPERIVGQSKGPTWKKHLYVGPRKSYHAELDQWETAVLKSALAEEGAIGWLRNPPRKDWSLCVPYKGAGGDDRGLYPDFLVFRRQNGHVVCDIIDPHSHALADAWPKAAGLAEYATRHGDEFGRIKLIAKSGNALKELDLKEEGTRAAVRAADSNAALLRLLQQA